MNDMTLFDESTVGAYAASRGLVDGELRRVATLSGGVSNIVMLVESGQRVVVKQALGKLRVADDWRADPARSQAEAAALQVLGSLTPEAVPVVLDADPERDALIISAAPPRWTMWKTELLDGSVRPGVASGLGSLLRVWHSATDHQPLPALLERTDLFEQLRLGPYFGTAARRRPALATEFAHVADEVRSRRRSIVLGDFSPKNVLVGSDGMWVIDLEVAHRGDPTFDLAFLATHLIAKAVHLPEARALLIAATGEFLDHYGDGPGADNAAHIARLVGALLIARVAGSSPLEYLSATSQGQVETIGTWLLTDPDAVLADALQTVSEL